MNSNLHCQLTKIIIVFSLLLSSYASFAQGNCIILENKKTNSKEKIEENKRIKITTVDGSKYVGKFSIIDDKTIKIEENTIPLDSITTIQKRSVFASIFRPVLLVVGTSFCILSVAVASYGGGLVPNFTVITAPIGLTSLAIPLLSDKHKSKNWSYAIQNE